MDLETRWDPGRLCLVRLCCRTASTETHFLTPPLVCQKALEEVSEHLHAPGAGPEGAKPLKELPKPHRRGAPVAGCLGLSPVCSQ